ncbi:conserved exported protein of unknown function [Petrocella atlantisensis]|uniref:Uncharacterized protein n=1 Tax=Petrocella atlantisensis TaxID=2173034 RepID=A0A3P7PK14_9FIRM|nr:hypothetical protein [Petrocella atlantisensis]VDN49288.1 conserved exported protein of unknown function [Petrocella atlantisensis]
MKKSSIVLGIVGAFVLMLGIGGITLAAESETSEYNNRNSFNMWDQNYGNSGFGMNFESRGFGGMGGMMGGRGYQSFTPEGEKLDIDTLTHEVEAYIDDYDENLAIGDIFVFDETEYYYSIIEKDTGMGAMELLVDPYTGYIFPEYGPNMMWNIKYGNHNGVGMMGGGMMGSRGMMGYDQDDYISFDRNYEETNDLTADEAYNEARDYLSRYGDDLSVSDDYHEFYGYFTYHVFEDGIAAGMLSVNGFSGDVWYHDWHGELIEIIDSHEDGLE